MSTPAHPDDLISLVAGEVDAATLAARHGVTEDEVLRWRAAFIAGMRASSSARPASRRWSRWALAAVLLVGTGAFAQLVVFTADSPAQASQVNANFNQLKTWLEAKVGVVTDTQVRAARLSADAYMPNYANWNTYAPSLTGGAGIVNDNQSFQSLMIVGNSSAGGARRVRLYDDVSIPTGNLSVSNGCSVGGDLSVGGNAWGSGPTGQGWVSRAPCLPQTSSQRCPSGQYVCGLNFQHSCGANWWEEQYTLECCSL